MTRYPPIELTLTDDPLRGGRAVIARQDLGSTKIAATVPVSAEMLTEVGDPDIVTGIILAQMDRIFRPWRYPDPSPFPQIVLFPHLDRWTRQLGALRARLARRRPDPEEDP